MGKPELFSYLSAFITIVLAVALGDMIQSLHRLLRARRRVVWDGRPLAMAALIALATISEFFSLWGRLDLAEVSMVRLIWLMATPTLFALLAYASLPDDVPAEGLDLAIFWRDEHRYLVLLWLLANVLDIARMVEGALSARQDLWSLAVFVGPFVAGAFGALTILWFSPGKIGSWIGLTLMAGIIVFGVLGWAISV